MSGPVTVTQADRDAGAAYLAFKGQHGSAEMCRLGLGFRATAEHFAAHRQSAEAAFREREAALVEALENLANAARATPRFASPMLLAEADKALAHAKASSDGEGVGP